MSISNISNYWMPTMFWAQIWQLKEVSNLTSTTIVCIMISTSPKKTQIQERLCGLCVHKANSEQKWVRMRWYHLQSFLFPVLQIAYLIFKFFLRLLRESHVTHAGLSLLCSGGMCHPKVMTLAGWGCAVLGEALFNLKMLFPGHGGTLL